MLLVRYRPNTRRAFTSLSNCSLLAFSHPTALDSPFSPPCFGTGFFLWPLSLALPSLLLCFQPTFRLGPNCHRFAYRLLSFHFEPLSLAFSSLSHRFQPTIQLGPGCHRFQTASNALSDQDLIAIALLAGFSRLAFARLLFALNTSKSRTSPIHQYRSLCFCKHALPQLYQRSNCRHRALDTTSSSAIINLPIDSCRSRLSTPICSRPLVMGYRSLTLTSLLSSEFLQF